MRRSLPARIAVGAVLLALAPAVPASAAPAAGCAVTSNGVRLAPWSQDLGTGENGGVPDPIPSADADWTTVSPTAGPAYSITPNGAWVTSPNANWINSSTSSASGGSGGVVVDVDVTTPELSAPIAELAATRVSATLPIVPAKTTFRTTFDLPALSIARTLNLQFAADNGVTFTLNGVPIGGYDLPVPAGTLPPAAAFNTLHTLVWSGAGFVDGVNTLDATVTDYGVATGLIVLGSANACVPGVSLYQGCVSVSKDHLSFVSYSPAPHDLGTGEAGSTPFTPGTRDDDWTTSAPVPGPAFAVATYPGWATSTSSSWINSQASATAGLIPSRTYRVEFPMYDLAQYHDLDLWFAADNGVTFFLNGTTFIGGYDPAVAAGAVPDVQAFRTKHHLVWNGAGFVAGTNVLTAVVSDYGVATGLLVEGGSHDCGHALLGNPTS
jgi:hypothetical protein